VRLYSFTKSDSVQSRFDRYKNIPAVKLWKEANAPGTGAAYDLGSHLIDQILDLFGKPNRVTAILSNSRLIGDRDVPDAFIIHRSSILLVALR
jgi:predicted dehydrogenase